MQNVIGVVLQALASLRITRASKQKQKTKTNTNKQTSTHTHSSSGSDLHALFSPQLIPSSLTQRQPNKQTKTERTKKRLVRQEKDTINEVVLTTLYISSPSVYTKTEGLPQQKKQETDNQDLKLRPVSPPATAHAPVARQVTQISS